MDFNVEDYLPTTSYVNKDFDSVWPEITDTIPKLTSKWTPNEANESDPLVVLLKELAIVTDKLNYNIDKNILELFPATLTQTRSAYNVYNTLGYSPDWYISATTTVTFPYNGMIGSEIKQMSEFSENSPIWTIPRFTAVSDDDGDTVYTTLEDAIFNTCEVSKITVNAIEGTLNDFEVNGTTQILYNNLDSQNRLYFPETNIAQNGIFISNYSDFSDLTYESLSTDIYNEGITSTTVATTSTDENYTIWTRVDNLNQYMSGNKIYKLGVDTINGTVYLQFPDDIGELIEDGIYIKYITSSGENGNIGKGDLTKFLNSFTYTVKDDSGTEYTIDEQNVEVQNTKASQNGADPLTIEEMHEHFNKTIGVFNTLVTMRDYENYIYEYKDSLNNNIVSNIKVTDRYNDLEYSISYKTMLTNGTSADVALALNMSDVDGAYSDAYYMSPYDLKFYPLYPSVSITSKDEFDYTFNMQSVNGETQLIGNIASLNEVVKKAVESAKCVSHDYIDPCNPILIPYDLTGQIYLKSNVSTLDATEILTNVQNALYQNFNSRQLKWGKAINYGDVVDTILDSDNRIAYAGVDAIEYNDPIYNYDDQGYDVITKSILAGAMTWTDYKAYTYDYGMDVDDSNYLAPVIGLTSYVEALSDYSGESTDDGTGGTGDKETSNKEKATTYIVNTNETFTVLTPQYEELCYYGTYLFVIAYGDGELEANRPTKLVNNQKLYIYESKSDAQADIASFNSGSINFLRSNYILDAGTIVRPDLDITFCTNGFSDDSIINLGSSYTIYVLREASGDIKASNVITGAEDSANVYIATNSKIVSEFFENAGEGEGVKNIEYTLLSEEYLFYTDKSGSELGILGEGTTISSDVSTAITWITSSATTATLKKGNLGTGDYTSWTEVGSGDLHYRLNELNTFGANYVIYLEKLNASDENEATFKNYSPNTFFDIDGDTTIKYQLADVEEDENGFRTYNVNVNDWITFDKIISGSNYKALSRLSLLSGPNVEQQLYYLSNDGFTELDEDGNAVTDDDEEEVTHPANARIKYNGLNNTDNEDTENTDDDNNGDDTGDETEDITSDLPFLNTIQRVDIKLYKEQASGDTTDFDSTTSRYYPYAFQTSTLLVSEGGPELELDMEDNVEIFIYTGTLSANTYLTSGFSTVKEVISYDDNGVEKYAQKIYSLNVPGDSETLSMICFISSELDNDVQYMIVRGGKTIYFAVTHTITMEVGNPSIEFVLDCALNEKIESLQKIYEAVGSNAIDVLKGSIDGVAVTQIRVVKVDNNTDDDGDIEDAEETDDNEETEETNDNGDTDDNDDTTGDTTSSSTYSLQYYSNNTWATWEGEITEISDDMTPTIDTKDTTIIFLPNILSISRPYIIEKKATYYSKITNSYNFIDAANGNNYAIMASTDSYKILDANYLYVNGFCPLINPSSSTKIEDPTLGKSYFLSQHPLNGFALPYLHSVEGLTISSANILE